MRQWKEVQEVSRPHGVAFAGLCLSFVCVLGASSLRADDSALWHEFGLVSIQTGKVGSQSVTTYRMKDLTGALGAWESLRSSQSHPCDLASFCTQDDSKTALADDNYVLTFEGRAPKKSDLTAFLKSLPDKHDTSLPAILTFLPHQGRVPNSARYVLGPVSLQAFAPELVSAKPAFDQGAEAQIAEYDSGKGGAPVHLAVFYFPTPEMARLHLLRFETALNKFRVKRSGVLIAAVYGAATDEQADSLLSRVQYEAKVTWNDSPPPSPIRPMYVLLTNIMYLSGVLVALCAAAGLIYAGMRIYRRRYGSLESEEAMTTLHLTE